MGTSPRQLLLRSLSYVHVDVVQHRLGVVRRGRGGEVVPRLRHVDEPPFPFLLEGGQLLLKYVEPILGREER